MLPLLQLSLCAAILIAQPQGPATRARAGTAGRATQERESASYYFLLGRYLEGGGKIDDAIRPFARRSSSEPGSADRGPS